MIALYAIPSSSKYWGQHPIVVGVHNGCHYYIVGTIWDPFIPHSLSKGLYLRSYLHVTICMLVLTARSWRKCPCKDPTEWQVISGTPHLFTPHQYDFNPILPDFSFLSFNPVSFTSFFTLLNLEVRTGFIVM